MSKKILRHPDKEEVIRMLNNGESVRKVEAYLKEKYPSNKKLWLTSVTLQKFRKDNLQLDGKVLKDIQEAGKTQKMQIEQQAMQKQLEMSNAYQEKINAIADTHLDVATKIAQIDNVVGSRIEYWYNLLASGQDLPARADNELRKYIDQQILILQQYKKLVEGMADKTIDYNVNVTVLNDQISMMREVIREILVEFSAEKAMEFMERLNVRLSQLSYRAPDKKPVNVVDLQEIDDLSDDGENNNV